MGRGNGLSEENVLQCREDDCRNKLLNHLRRSELHNQTRSYAEHKAILIRMVSPTPLICGIGINDAISDQ